MSFNYFSFKIKINTQKFKENQFKLNQQNIYMKEAHLDNLKYLKKIKIK